MSAPAPGRVRVLEPTVADRIAAGEVVERPASVVKELIENALDAGARRITIEIEGAGQTLIRVGDDGGGIHPEDVALAVRRFATSKIRSGEDLIAVRTLGFRGEALPSIAAVSHFELITALPGARAARRIRIAGGVVDAEEDAAGPPGTVVTVRHLFFNTPARRKFLKSPAREFALIVEAVQRLALAYPAVAFHLRHEGEEVLRYPPDDEAGRVAQILGRAVFDRCLPFAAWEDEIALRGWLGRPELARGTRSLQYLTVNGRPVHSRVVAAAIEQAYRQLIPAGKVPAYAVFLDLPRRRVDVNVHPRKLEVRFDDEHRLFGAVARAAREALRAASLAPAAGEGTAVAGPPAGGERMAATPQIAEAAVAAEEGARGTPPLTQAGRLPPLRLLGQLHRTYLLAQGEEGLVVIDQHAAHERVLYERLLRARRAARPAGQTLITPLAVELDGREAALLPACREALAALGFHLEPFGERAVLLRAIPPTASPAGAERLLRELLSEALERDRPGAARDLLERLTIATACHTAIRAGDSLSGDQMAALLRDLAATEDPFTCFHGRPTMVTVRREQLERWFLRR